MFKVGDKVVCINIKNKNADKYKSKTSLDLMLEKLELNKIYTATYVTHDKRDKWLSIKGLSFRFKSHRFISLTQFRKQKIKKICSRLETV